MQVKQRINHNERTNDVDELIRLLKEDTDEPNLFHGRALQELPEWFDEEKFHRGQKFFNENYYSLFVSKLCGLLVILCTPRVLKILIMTQRSSKPNTAFKRYLSTLSHMLLWYNGDILNKNSWVEILIVKTLRMLFLTVLISASLPCFRFDRVMMTWRLAVIQVLEANQIVINLSRLKQIFEKAFKSLTEVYMKHSAANKRGIAEKTGTLSQSSLAITQFGFMGFGLLMPEKLGIKVSDQRDLEGFIHFWRTIGYLVGVDDRFNICKGNVDETREVCKRILEEILWPFLKNPSKEFIHMTTVLLQGMWAMIPFLDVEGFMAFTYNLAGLEVSPFTNWWSQGIFNFQKYVHETLLHSRYFSDIWRTILNFQMWIAVVISSKFPLFAYFTFGIPITSKMEAS